MKKERISISIYLAALSYLILEIVKLWETNYYNNGIPFIFWIPFVPVIVGLVISFLSINSDDKNQ